MKLLIFGAGKYYKNRKPIIESEYTDDEIIGFIDNRIHVESLYDAKPIFPPYYCKELSFDRILLMSQRHEEMRQQLLAYGIEDNKILVWQQYLCEKYRGKIHLVIKDVEIKTKRALVFIETLDYNGGSLVGIHAANALKLIGYEVWVAATNLNTNEKFVHEIVSFGLNLAICYGAPYLGKEELHWIQRFDVVLVNVFQMLPCAVEISRIKPTLWWLHEPEISFLTTLKEYPKYNSVSLFTNIHILAVSSIPRIHFRHFFPSRSPAIMPYGLPDYNPDRIIAYPHNPFVFAIIGSICPLKGHDILLDALELLPDKDRNRLKILMIGRDGDDFFSQEISNRAKALGIIEMTGILSREEMTSLFPMIDGIICASRQDSLPTTIAEGMIFGKICIASDVTGMAYYIDDGTNGFIFKNEQAISLKDKIQWILYHRESLASIQVEARKTYEKFFTLEGFSGRLEKEILRAQEIFRGGAKC